MSHYEFFCRACKKVFSKNSTPEEYAESPEGGAIHPFFVLGTLPRADHSSFLSLAYLSRSSPSRWVLSY
jgi:hypothetical protein